MVTCAYCGTELPADAMFCGECGRAVVASSAPARSMIPPPLTRPVGEAENGTTCVQCGAALSPDDIFCGECGFVARSIGASAVRPRDTNVVERLEQVERDADEDRGRQRSAVANDLEQREGGRRGPHASVMAPHPMRGGNVTLGQYRSTARSSLTCGRTSGERPVFAPPRDAVARAARATGRRERDRRPAVLGRARVESLAARHWRGPRLAGLSIGSGRSPDVKSEDAR